MCFIPSSGSRVGGLLAVRGFIDIDAVVVGVMVAVICDWLEVLLALLALLGKRAIGAPGGGTPYWRLGRLVRALEEEGMRSADGCEAMAIIIDCL
jgi:hypothetical protein